MTSINTLKLNNNIILNGEDEKQKEVKVLQESGGVELLGLTGRFGSIVGMKLKNESDVYSGDVDKEINNLLNEKNQINEILKSNINASANNLGGIALASTVSAPKSIGFVQYTGANTNLKAKTDTSAIMSCFTPDPRYAAAEQKKVFEAGVKVMADWLDNYISNYSTKVTQGLKNGESEAKLTFLLRIRKSIENCDFPVGFAQQSMTATPDGGFRVVGGSYNWGYIPGEYENLENKAYTNRSVEHDYNRKLLLNTDLYAFNRKYKTEAEAMAAFNRGESVSVSDMIFSNDETFYKYAGASLAGTLIHELIHSTHVSNEAITYFSCEVFEDDFNNKPIGATYSPEIVALMNANGINLSEITYSQLSPNISVPVDGGGVAIFNPGFGHNLTNTDSVAAHGHKENTAYSNYNDYSTGNTLADDKKELLNFAVVA